LELANTYDVIVNGFSATKGFRLEKNKKIRDQKKEIMRLNSQKELLYQKEKIIKQNLGFGIIPSKKLKIKEMQSNQVKGIYTGILG
jgi:hypothetical protein